MVEYVLRLVLRCHCSLWHSLSQEKKIVINQGMINLNVYRASFRKHCAVPLEYLDVTSLIGIDDDSKSRRLNFLFVTNIWSRHSARLGDRIPQPCPKTLVRFEASASGKVSLLPCHTSDLKYRRPSREWPGHWSHRKSALFWNFDTTIPRPKEKVSIDDSSWQYLAIVSTFLKLTQCTGPVDHSRK
jgi:hypothetical protein